MRIRVFDGKAIKLVSGIAMVLVLLLPAAVAYGSTLQGKLSVTETKLTPSDTGDRAADRSFGYSVSISGNTVLVGRYYDSEKAKDAGAAHVFVRDETTGVWTEQDKLIADDGGIGDELGLCGFISGDTVLVAGGDSAYMFVRNGTSWTQQAKLSPTGGVACDGYRARHSVYINKDTAVLASQESAYVFVRNGTSWSQQAKLTANDGVSGDEFGYSSAVSGNTAVVGADNDDEACPSEPSCNSGSAYVFLRDETTAVWTQQAKLTASDGANSDHFGYSVAISEDGNTVAVGSFRADDGRDNRTDVGAVYVFSRDGTSWKQQAKLTASDGERGDAFGASVAISGNSILAGASSDDKKGKNGRNLGSAYLFRFDGASWTQQAKLTASDGVAEDWFAQSLFISGDTAVVVARFGSGRPGAAYVYEFTSSERKGGKP